MFEYNKTCDAYEKMSFEELRGIAINDSVAIMPALLAMGKDGPKTFCLFACVACASSGRLELEQYKLFEEILGISVPYEKVQSMIEVGKDRDTIKAVEDIIDMYGILDEQVKIHMVSFCLAFCAANGKVDLRERRLIRKLIRES